MLIRLKRARTLSPTNLNFHDLVGEFSRGLRSGEALVRTQRPFVLLDTTDLELRDQIFGMPTRVLIRERIVEPVAQHAVVEDSVAQAVTPSATRNHVWSCVHVLNTASDGRIHRAHQDFMRCGHDRLRAGAADPIDGHDGDLDRQSPVDRRPARGIHLVAGLHRISHDDRADLIRLQARLLKSVIDGCRSQFNGCRQMFQWLCVSVQQSRPSTLRS